MRHPRSCKYWKGASEGCRRGDECSYLHDNGKNSEADKIGETIKERHAENKTNFEENEKKEENEGTSTDLKNGELEKVIEHKDKVINDFKVREASLEEENKNLVSQVERLNRVATNLHKALTQAQLKN